jgi:hypothetical protein
MSVVLYGLSMLAFFAGGCMFAIAKSAIHESVSPLLNRDRVALRRRHHGRGETLA